MTGRDPGFIVDQVKNGLSAPEYVTGDVGTTIARFDADGYVLTIEDLEAEIAAGWGAAGQTVTTALSKTKGLTIQSTEFRYRVSFDVASSTFDRAALDVVADFGLDALISDNRFFNVLPKGGVNTSYLDQVAHADQTNAKVSQIYDDLGDSKLIVSVGRTDYTKGGVQQLKSFERVLEANSKLRDENLRLMHISVSANWNMTVYAEIQSEIEEAADPINGRFGTFDWQPLTLISKAMSLGELVAYYRAADVA